MASVSTGLCLQYAPAKAHKCVAPATYLELEHGKCHLHGFGGSELIAGLQKSFQCDLLDGNQRCDSHQNNESLISLTHTIKSIKPGSDLDMLAVPELHHIKQASMARWA